MPIAKKDDLRLKLGNLFLAACLSIVPTIITLGLFGAHGYILCRKLDVRTNETEISFIEDKCNEASIDSLYSYFIWIWIFITVPTWRWFYLGHVRRYNSNSK